MEEIIEANKKSFEIKKNNKLKEIKEEQELLEYNKKKYMEEQNKLKENETMKQLKEMEIAKLREKQRKLYDNKNIIKEIMDKRAFEEGERLERKKIKEEYTKIQKLKENMKLENEKLLDFKKKIKLEEANKNDREFADNAKKSLEEIDKEKEKEKKKIETMLKYRQDLKKMILLI